MKINCLSIFEIIKKGMLLFLFSYIYLLAQVNTKGAELLSIGKGEFNNVRAVIVGISKYKEIDTLSFAHKDAISFRDYLCSPAGGFIDRTNIKLITNEEATIGRILPEIMWLVDESEEGDLAIIYFSGHGDVMSEVNEPYLLTVETPKTDYSISAIDMEKLKNRIALITKKNAHVILIADACRSGNLSGGKEGAKLLTSALLEDWEYTIKILSCQPNQVSQEGSKWGDGAGVFTYYLLLGLKGLADEDRDQLVNLEELRNYLGKKVKAETNGNQNPAVSGDPNTILAKVDSVTFASLTSEGKEELAGVQLALRGKETTIGSLDSLTKSLIKKFKYCLNKGLLINSPDSMDNAWRIYSNLKDREDIQTVLTDMKTLLITSLQDKSQIIINSFLRGRNEDADTVNLYDAYQEINLALSLIDENHILYDILKPKSLFMESIFYTKNQYVERINLLHECINIEPDAAYAYCELGRAYHDAERYEEAILNYGKAIELSPKWTYPYYNVGIVYADLKQNEKAIENYSKAIEIDPDYEDAYNNLGLIYYNAGDHAKAIEYYNKALEIDPNYKLGYYNLGIAYYDLKHMDKARENFYKATEIDPSYSDAYNYLGLTYYNVGDYDKAIEYYNKALAIDPNYILGYYNSGIAYYDLKQIENARENFYKVTEIDPSYSDAYNYLGLTYYVNGDYDQAIEYYNKALAIDSNYILGYYNSGIVYYNLEKMDKARENFQKAAEIDPSYTDAYNYLGITYYYEGNYANAIEYYNKVVEIDPNYKLAYYNLGLVYSDLGETEKALLNYNHTIKLDSNYVNAYDKAGIIYYQLKDYESGIKIYNKYIQFYPADSYGYQMRGLNYFYNNDYDKALEDLQMVVEINPDVPDGYYNLACYYSVTKNVDESLANLEKAFQLGYNNFDHVEKDTDLNGIRSNPEFNKLIEKYKN